MTPLEEAQNAMHRLLAEHGAWSPLDLLLATNKLHYDDYHAWLRGERDTLDGDFADGPSDTRGLLRDLHVSAQALKLEPQAIAVYGIEGNAGAELRASADASLDEMLRTKFQAADGRAQLDLFMDTEESSAANDVAAALLARDVETAAERLRRLADISPQHWVLPFATTLIDALKAAPAQSEDVKQRRSELEQRWLPAASAVLDAQARDFMVPLWRDLGRALEGVPFDSFDPHGHAAWAYRNGLDWASVRRTVHAVVDHAGNAHLTGWLAEAEWRLRRAAIARQHWFALCWRDPDHFEQLVEQRRLPDAALQKAWQDMLDADIEPALSTAWLPAWAVLPDQALVVNATPCNGDSAPERAFDILIALVAGGSDRQEMANRKALQALHPGLLMRYLEAREA